MSDAVLELRDVSKSFRIGDPGQIDVLKGANLSLRAGEAIALVAPSGAGKSTLLHIAGLLDVADSGDVLLKGNALGRANDQQRTLARRQEIGFVYQFHHLLPEFSAQENLILPQLANGVSKVDATKRAMELMAAVGVEDRASHRPAELSGGQQQRVAFCRALANRPSLLLADEPTGNLDPGTSKRVFETLLDLVRNHGMAAMIATHDADIASKMDRVLRLDEGKLVEIHT